MIISPQQLPSVIVIPIGLIIAGALGVLVALLPPTAVLVVIGGLVGVALLSIRPHWCLIGLLLARSTLDFAQDSVQFGTGALSFNLVGLFNILGAGLAFFLLARRFARGDSLLPSLPLKTYGLFLLIVLLSGLTSSEIVVGIKAWARFAGALGIALLATEITHKTRAVNAILTTILIAAILPIALGLYQTATGGGVLFPGYVGTTFEFRTVGTFDHPATLGSFMLVVATLAVAAFVLKRHIMHPLILSLIAGLSLVTLLFTYARAQWLGCVIALFVIASLYYRRLIFIGLVGIIFVLLLPTVQERLTGELSNDSLAWRREVWGEALFILRRPTWLGNGPDTSPLWLGERLQHVTGPPHNDYLRVPIEFGLFGALAYGWMLFVLLGVGWNGMQNSATVRQAHDTAPTDLVVSGANGSGHSENTRLISLTLFAITLGSLFTSFADNWLSYTAVQWYIWVMVGLLVKPHPWSGADISSENVSDDDSKIPPNASAPISEIV